MSMMHITKAHENLVIIEIWQLLLFFFFLHFFMSASWKKHKQKQQEVSQFKSGLIKIHTISISAKVYCILWNLDDHFANVISL